MNYSLKQIPLVPGGWDVRWKRRKVHLIHDAMKVSTYRAVCNDCKTEFHHPLLSDMSYGQFVARGEKGTAFGYFLAFDNIGWEKIHGLVEKFYSVNDIFSKRDCFQWIIGKCLDPIDNQELSIVRGPVCPSCHGTNVEYGDSYKTGELNVPDATFSKFLALSNVEQEIMIKDLCNIWLETKTKP